MKIGKEHEQPISAKQLAIIARRGVTLFRHGQLRSVEHIINSNRKDETLLMKKGYRTDFPDKFPDGSEVVKCRRCSYSDEIVAILDGKPRLLGRWCSLIRTRVDEEGHCQNAAAGMTPQVICFDPNHCDRICDIEAAVSDMIAEDSRVMNIVTNRVVNKLSTKKSENEHGEVGDVDKSESCEQAQDVVDDGVSSDTRCCGKSK